MEEEQSGPPTSGYLHACQRAELLGLPTPSEEEWLNSEECRLEREAQEQEEHDNAVAQELDENDDSMKRIGGGLEELNTILNATQKKINKFKTVCGSIGTLLKARVTSSQPGTSPGTPEHQSRSGSVSMENQASTSDQAEENIESTQNQQSESVEVDDEAVQDDRQRISAARKTDMNAKVTSHLGKLDSLISKAENAQYSIKHQSKQMKAFLK